MCKIRTDTCIVLLEDSLSNATFVQSTRTEILLGIVSNSATCHTVQTFNSCASRPDVCQCLVVQIPIDNMSENKPSTSMTHVACESKLRSVVRSFIHPGLRNWVTIGRAIVYYYRAAHALSARIKCRHCTWNDPITQHTKQPGNDIFHFIPISMSCDLLDIVLTLSTTSIC